MCVADKRGRPRLKAGQKYILKAHSATLATFKMLHSKNRNSSLGKSITQKTRNVLEIKNMIAKTKEAIKVLEREESIRGRRNKESVLKGLIPIIGRTNSKEHKMLR